MCMVGKPNIPDIPDPPKAARLPDIREAARLRSKRKREKAIGRKATILTSPTGISDKAPNTLLGDT